MRSRVESGRRIARDLRVVRVVALARKDGRDALAPGLLEGGQEPYLVVDEHVVRRRVAPLDVVELAAPCGCRSSTRPLTASRRPERSTFRGWKTTSPSERMTVGAPAPEARDDVERLRDRAAPRTDSSTRNDDGLEHVRVARVLEPVALERAQVVGVAELGREAPRRSPSSAPGARAPTSRVR